MPQHRNKAVVAGLAVTLAFGGVALPAVANTEQAPVTDSDPNGVGDPAPADYDKADYYEGTEGVATFASARSASTLSPVSLSDEMKYFTKYESGCDYDKGLSYGDGYNAMGYYQFDRRYSLLPFIEQVYGYNSTKYDMLRAALAYRDVLQNPSYEMYDYTSRQLSAPAQILNEAWHAAYAADPAEFSALQDSYAYNNYYLPVQSSLLNTYGVDVRDRADCVKGLVWGMCNLFGQGGVQKFFKGANIDNGMTDRELITALCDTVVEYVDDWYPSQPQYWDGWKNRYKKEKATCLAYMDQHDAEQNANGQGQTDDQPNADEPGQDDSGAGLPVAPDVPNDSEGQDGDGGGSEGGSQGDAGSGGSGSDGGAAHDGDAGSNDAVTPEGGQGSDAEQNAGGSQNSDDDADDAPNTSVPDGNAGQGSSGDQENAGGSGSGSAGNSGSAQGGTGNNGGSTQDGSAGTGNSAGTGGSAGGGSTQDGSTQDTTTGGGSTHAGEGQGSSDDEQADASTGDEEDDGKTTPKDPAPRQNTTPDPMNSLGTTGDKTTSGQGDGAQSTSAFSSGKATAGGLPGTGDIATMVLTGAAGLAVAGSSFLSLAKKERAGVDGSADSNEE